MDNSSKNNPITKLLHNAKTFGPTDWAIKNKTAVYLITLILSIWGIGLFISLPKEQYPDVVIPNIFVQTVYVGADGAYARVASAVQGWPIAAE